MQLNNISSGRLHLKWRSERTASLVDFCF